MITSDGKALRVWIGRVTMAGFLLISLLATGMSSPEDGPTITDIGTLEVGDTWARVTWTIDRPVTGVVEYGLTDDYGQRTPGETSFDYSRHIQRLSYLLPDRTYHYRVRSTDEDGNEVVSNDQTFSTSRLPPPDPEPPTTDAPRVYGPRIGGTSLANTRIGFDDIRASYRFRAARSAGLEGIRIYIVADEEGYGAGTGGVLRISLRPDDGTAQHHPSKTVLTQIDAVHPAGGAGNLYTFPDQPALTAGELYHIVFANVDPRPQQNYVSLNGAFQFDVPKSADPWQHGYDNLDWAQLIRFGSGDWSYGSGGAITPIMDLVYLDGSHQGMGYVEFWSGAPRQTKDITGAQDMARERFTVSGGDRRVRSVTVRLKRVDGSGPIVIQLEDSDGRVIEEGAIPASKIAVSDPADRSNDATWATHTFKSPITLRHGDTYHLRLSTDASTTYNVSAIREGTSFGYDRATYFADGTAEETADGGAMWQAPFAWDKPNPEGDWQIYFTEAGETT